MHIKGFQQFEDTVLDFTHPETGEPLEKICFIGRNGTGKSTLLRLIDVLLQTGIPDGVNGFLIIEISSSVKDIYVLLSNYGFFSLDYRKDIISLLNIATPVVNNKSGFGCPYALSAGIVSVLVSHFFIPTTHCSNHGIICHSPTVKVSGA